MHEFLFVVALAIAFILFFFGFMLAAAFPKTLKAFDKKLSDFISGAEQ